MNDASTATFHAPVATAANPLATEEDAPVLFLHGICRTYNQGSAPLEVLKDAELALWPGQSVALVAPSGTGKSTLLHVAGLLEQPDAGEVYVDKVPTTRLADSERTRGAQSEFAHGLIVIDLAGGGMQRRDRMAYCLGFDDPALLHQCLAGDEPALPVLVVDERQQTLVKILQDDPAIEYLNSTVGSGGPNMLKLTARHADVWNASGIAGRDVGSALTGSQQLDEACAAIGRDPDELRLRRRQVGDERDHLVHQVANCLRPHRLPRVRHPRARCGGRGQ